VAVQIGDVSGFDPWTPRDGGAERQGMSLGAFLGAAIRAPLPDRAAPSALFYGECTRLPITGWPPVQIPRPGRPPQSGASGKRKAPPFPAQRWRHGRAGRSATIVKGGGAVHTRRIGVGTSPNCDWWGTRRKVVVVPCGGVMEIKNACGIQGRAVGRLGRRMFPPASYGARQGRIRGRRLCRPAEG